MTERDWEESARAQNAVLPGDVNAWTYLSPPEGVLTLWMARSQHTISKGLQGRGFPYPDQPHFQCIAYLNALREAEFFRRLQGSQHVRELVKLLGNEAHFIIGGLWWLLKQTASPLGLLAVRGELVRSSRQRARSLRERRGGQTERIAVKPGSLYISVTPLAPDRRKPGRRSVERDPALWALRIFQTLAGDHAAKVKGRAFRKWDLIGALSYEFVVFRVGNPEGEAIRREVSRVKTQLSEDLTPIRERIRWVAWNAMHGPHLADVSPKTDEEIPWSRLQQQWEEAIRFTPLEPTGEPVVIRIRNPSPLSPGQSIGDWLAAERKAGNVSILSLPHPR